MPHVIVKLWPGQSEQQKARLAEEIVKVVMATTNNAEASISVAVQEVTPEDWPETVYRPDVLDGPGQLYKKPGYNPFE